MKAVIVYYSFSGNTKKVSEDLAEYLKQKGEVETVELKPLDESDKFIVQAARGFRKKRARLAPVDFDLGQYDLICLGTPVWGFGPAPAMNTFLDECKGIQAKAAIVFTTYGSGAGNNKCLEYMQNILKAKGSQESKRFCIQQFKVKDKEFVLSEIKKIL
ncbi:MAG: flavodoxin [Candidatus Omnitrophica bacterium]|nr:flavodoxin [Candidatus Omnitrophota bacterium]MDD5611149.1 flavodoxin [Candidatus Omnitrophota bacterium]